MNWRLAVQPTRYAGWPRVAAWLVLAGMLAVLAWGLTTYFGPPPPPPPTPQEVEERGTDLRLYHRIVARVHAGESYYDVAGSELRRDGYASSSVLNWRLPTYAWLFGYMPAPICGQILLIALAIWAIYLSVGFAAREAGRAPALVVFIMLFGAFMWSVDGEAYYIQELWAAVLIQISVMALAAERRLLGVSTGVLALLFRELALGYVLVCLVIALWTRRWRELLGWIAGLVLYAGFTAYHANQVLQRVLPGDIATESWLCWGGIAFVLKTTRMHEFAFRLGNWFHAAYLPLALVGTFAWRGKTGWRMAMTCFGYKLSFLAVGQEFNDYWGIMDVALLSTGAAISPWAVRDLWASASGAKPQATVTTESVEMAHGGDLPADT
jgi:hypothetical protein